METQRPIAAPGLQLNAQYLEGRSLARLEGLVFQAIDDGKLEVAHAVAIVEREKRPIPVERHDADAAQTPDDRAVDHDQRPAIADLHELDVRHGLDLAERTRRRLLEQRDNRPADVGMNLLKPTVPVSGAIGVGALIVIAGPMVNL